MADKCPVSGKICHPSKEVATKVKNQVAYQRKSFDLEVYQCKDCQKWHFGHNRAKFYKRIKHVLRQARRERKS